MIAMIKKSCEEKRHEKKKRILRKRNHLRNKMAENGSEKRSKYENIYIFFTNFHIKRSLVYLRKEEMDNNIRFITTTPTVVVLFFMIQRKYLHRHYFCVSTICNKYKDARNNIFQRSVLILKNEYAALKKEYI